MTPGGGLWPWSYVFRKGVQLSGLLPRAPFALGASSLSFALKASRHVAAVVTSSVPACSRAVPLSLCPKLDRRRGMGNHHQSVGN